MWTGLAFGGAACCLVALLLPGRAAGLIIPDPGQLAVVSAAWVAALATARPWSRGGRTVAAVLGLGAALAAGTRLAADVRGGLPTAPAVLLALGGALAAIGALAVAVRRAPRAPRRRPTAVALAAVALLVVAVPALVIDRTVSSTTAAAGPVPPLAAVPGTSSWSWRTPAPVLWAQAAGTGVALGLADGSLVALDGPTGLPRWRYARPGAYLSALRAAPDGSSVLAAYHASDGRDAPDNLLVVLDGVTGAVRWQRPLPELVIILDELLPTTAVLPVRQRLARDPDDNAWQGLDLRTGQSRWTWRAPAGCTSPYGIVAHGRARALAFLDCPDRIGVVGIDDTTGRTAWTHTIGLSGTAPRGRGTSTELHLSATSDGGVAYLQVLGSRLAVDPLLARPLLDPETGRVTAATPDPAEGWVDVDAGTLPVLRQSPETATSGIEAIDPATGRRIPLDRTVCAEAADLTTTATTFLTVCPRGAGPTGTGAPDIVVQPFAGGPVTRVPLPPTVAAEHADDATLLAAPGAVVLVPSGDDGVVRPVTGLPAVPAG